MPYKPKRYKRKYKRKNKKSVDARQNAKIKKLQNMVYSQQESKYIDDVTPLTTVNSTGFLTQSLIGYENITATGATVSGSVIPSGHTTRLGNKINLKKLEVRFHMVNSTTDDYNKIRVICFTLADPDTSSGLGLPTVGDILETTSNLRSFYKKNSQFRYKILYDRTHSTGGCQSSTINPNFVGCGGVPCSKDFKMVLRWPKGYPIHYKSSAPATPIKNQIWFLFISDSLSVNHPRISTISRLNFDP